MLQKILFESPLTKTPNKSPNNNLKLNSVLQGYNFNFSNKILYHKYSKFEYSFSLFCTNNLIFNEKCRIVARFKDFLVLDDSTEFLRRFYSKKELKARLKRIFDFYESYCKIFPNYMILPENQFLYRNIGKKQKMIDAFNEIKREEEENRKNLKLGLIKGNEKNKEENKVFTKKIQESIDRYHPSLSNLLNNTFMNDTNHNINNEIGENKNINLNSQLPLSLIEAEQQFLSNKNSFLESDKNINDNSINSQNSIYKIVQILNNNNIIQTNLNIVNNNDPDNKKLNSNQNVFNKIHKIEFKNNNTISNSNNKNNKTINNKIIKKNNNSNTVKHNTKKLFNINKQKANNIFNKMNTNNNSNKNINNHKIKNNSINKNKENKENANVQKTCKFISHKQNVSVPSASHMLNSNSNENNILDEKNTIKIINTINNIIINDDKEKTINNGMIININNNYFQLKHPNKANGKLIKRVKSKEEKIKEKSKGKKSIHKIKSEKDDEFHHLKYPIENRTYTTYNTNNNNNNRQNKKLVINERSSHKKSESNNNNHLDTQKNKNSNNKNMNNCYFNIINNNKNNSNRHNITYNMSKNTNNKKLRESKTLYNDSHFQINNNKTHTEINNNNYKNIKLKKNKEKPKMEGCESIDNKKISLNRKIVNNYFATTQKKKKPFGRFQTQYGTSLNTITNDINITNKKSNNDFTKKIEPLNIYNTIQNENNPIKFKLDKKKIIIKNKTNSLQLNNKNEFLNSFNFAKEKISGTNIETDITGVDENKINYKKNSTQKYINNKTQSNSEAELMRDLNKRKIVMNAFINKSLKKNNEKKNDSNNIMNKMNNNKSEMQKINVKEMKEKYHKLLIGNKLIHGSYDTTNRLHLFKKFRTLNNNNNKINNSHNNTIISNKSKRSPLDKNQILSPGKKIFNNLSNYIKTPFKNKHNINTKEIFIENNNKNNGNGGAGGKLNIIGIKNKQSDINNKKNKFLKK